MAARSAHTCGHGDGDGEGPGRGQPDAEDARVARKSHPGESFPQRTAATADDDGDLRLRAPIGALWDPIWGVSRRGQGDRG